jgi:hypothetical protein
MHEVSPGELRKFVFDRFLKTARAPLVEELMQQFQMGRDEVVQRLEELQAAHHILLLPGTGRILMANPFSNLPTPFRVSSNSLQYFANCAWDAVAMHLVLNREVRVSSHCHHCGAPIEFGLNRGAGTPNEGADVVIFLGTPVSNWYENLVVTCSNTMVFFSSRVHLDEWQRTHPGWEGATLSVDQTIEVVRPISTGRATLDYQMPSRAELMTHRKSIGRSGAFWTF